MTSSSAEVTFDETNLERIDAQLLDFDDIRGELAFNKSNQNPVKIIVGEDCFHIHKDLLIAVSPVFKKMLTANMKEQTSSEIHFDNDPLVVSTFVQFVYTGRLNCTYSLLPPLLRFSHCYDIVILFNLCIELFQKHLSPKRLVIACNTVHNLIPDESLHSMLVKVSDDMEKLINEDMITSIQYDLLLKILSLPLSVGFEIELFNALVKWTQQLKGGIDANLEKFHSLMCRVDFTIIDSQDIEEIVNPLRASLPYDYFVDCMMARICPMHEVEIPDRFGITFSSTVKDSQFVSQTPKRISVTKLESRSYINSFNDNKFMVTGSFPLLFGRVYTWKVKFKQFQGFCNLGVIEQNISSSGHQETFYFSDHSMYNGQVLTIEADMVDHELRVVSSVLKKRPIKLSEDRGIFWYPIFILHPQDYITLTIL
ncbi:hypothetical protein P9112_005266 [Eukaryota sp. TZLM1-RC]